MKKLLAGVVALVLLFSCGAASAEYEVAVAQIDDPTLGEILIGETLTDIDNPNAFVNVMQRYNSAVQELGLPNETHRTFLMSAEYYQDAYVFATSDGRLRTRILLSDASGDGTVVNGVSYNFITRPCYDAFCHWAAIIMALDENMTAQSAMSVVRDACLKALLGEEDSYVRFGQYKCDYRILASFHERFNIVLADADE